MVQVSCQCFLLLVIAVLLVARPTSELFVGQSQSSNHILVDKYSKHVERRDNDIERLEEGLAYRPNERDKSSIVEHLTPESTAGTLHSQRLKKLKLRLKRASGPVRSDSFVFPDQLSTTTSRSDRLGEHQFVVPNTASPPPCARGDTFCEAVDEYPSEHVIRLLRKEPVFVRGFFQNEKEQPNSLIDDIVQDRIDASDENPLCPSQEVTVYPKLAKNKDGNWLFVINQDEYVQGVRVEKCILNDHECSFPGGLSLGYRSQCKQKYIYRKLVALNGTGQGMISDSFKFPSCCSCIIKLDRNFASNRLGGGHLAPLPLTLPKTTPTPRVKSHQNKN